MAGAKMPSPLDRRPAQAAGRVSRRACERGAVAYGVLR